MLGEGQLFIKNPGDTTSCVSQLPTQQLYLFNAGIIPRATLKLKLGKGQTMKCERSEGYTGQKARPWAHSVVMNS